MIRNKGKVDVVDQCNGILGGLVSITAGCFLFSSWETVLVGLIGGIIATMAPKVFDRMGIDDPVGAIGVHGMMNNFVSKTKCFRYI